MSFNYENFLLDNLGSDKVVVLQEQMFAKHGELDPDKIYIITKMLTSTITYGAETQPYQLLILSQQDKVKETQQLFDEFTVKYNFFAEIVDGTFVKHQYSSPVVMSNFNEAAYGYRSVLYVSASLVIMEDIIDIENLKIDGALVTPINFTFQYSMTGNTQPINGETIASTVKNMATFNCTMNLPPLRKYDQITGKDTYKASFDEYEQTLSTGLIPTGNQELKARIVNGYIKAINQTTGVISYMTDNNACVITYWLEEGFINDMMNIVAGKKSGNKDFNISFLLNDTPCEYDCKLITAQMSTAPNEIPALQVGFQR